MPDEDTLVLGMTSNNEAIIGCLWYDEESEAFICTSMYESVIVVKWAHIAPVELPDRLKDATKAAIKYFDSGFALEEEAAAFFAGWDAAINFIKNQLT